MVTIPPAEKARRYRHKLVDLLEKVEAALRPGAGKAELAALADEAHTVRTQLDVEERCEARPQAAASHGGAIGAPRPGTRMLDLRPPASDPTRQAGESIERLKRKVLSEGEN
jgi:hypothetical protein